MPFMVPMFSFGAVFSSSLAVAEVSSSSVSFIHCLVSGGPKEKLNETHLIHTETLVLCYRMFAANQFFVA